MNSEKKLITVAFGAVLLFQELSKYGVKRLCHNKNRSHADMKRQLV